ncbi:hypothetical protein Q644_01285 [Brucella intermedia 229E]|uniref:Uncharacterized protein n=1 Tax=Brucella intermedia 229E TaxID=1337887 RepID=U4VGX1_9HYPH|nr:hypothetical protein Q644_01285 [Brucella intermedia 229E]
MAIYFEPGIRSGTSSIARWQAIQAITVPGDPVILDLKQPSFHSIFQR